MNNAEKYIHAVYQEKSFSKAAEKMFVSQPALSSAIKNHETQLGYKIFNRKTIPLSLTCEGEVYIEYLQEKILLEQQLNYRLHNLDNVGKKTLYIGGTSSTSLIALPKLCKEFCNRFPDINIKIDMDKRRSALLEQLEKGLVDIVVETNADHKKFDSTVLWEEKYMLIVRKDYPGIESLKKYSLSYDEVLSGVYPPEKKITDWDLFKNVEVFKPGETREMRKTFSELFQEDLPRRITVTNFTRMDMQYALMKEGLGAIVQPQSIILEKGYNTDEYFCFAIEVPNNVRKTMLIYRKDIIQESHITNFIEVAKEMYDA